MVLQDEATSSPSLKTECPASKGDTAAATGSNWQSKEKEAHGTGISFFVQRSALKSMQQYYWSSKQIIRHQKLIIQQK